MKTITIAGNIGRDAEVRRTNDGSPVASFTVAVEDRSSREKSTLWFDCSLWGKRGESLSQYLTKGSKVVVSGDLGRREYEGKTYLTVRANDVTLMGGKLSGSGSVEQQFKEVVGSEVAAMKRGVFDDDIPFAPEWRA